MRLYALKVRFGSVRKGLYPWFKAPVAEAPLRYFGWVWNPEIFEWVKTSVTKIRVNLEVPRFPKPLEPPKKATPTHVPGWDWNVNSEYWYSVPLTRQEGADGIEPDFKPLYIPVEAGSIRVKGWVWSEKEKDWAVTIYATELVEFTPPRSLPPGVDLAEVFAFDPYFAKDLETALLLVRLGQWDTLEGGNAFMRLVWKVHQLDPAAKYPVHIAEGIFDGRKIMQAKRSWLASQEAWQMRMNALGPAKPDYFGTTIAIVVMGTIAALYGWLIGTIAARLAFGEQELSKLVEPMGTYLMGPENWQYSRNIGRSMAGKLFYSVCGEIGTEYVRHMRGRTGWSVDILDFPGGFLETGYVFPMFVKYVWHKWEINYIGFLEPVGPNRYVLMKGFDDPYARLFHGQTLPSEYWCKDFHWYL